MNNFHEEQSLNILSSASFKELSNKLFNAYVSNMTSKNNSELTELDVVKLVESIQFFYKSENHKVVKEGAELLAMLLDVVGDEYEGLAAFANYIFCEAGNFPNTALVKKRYPSANLRFNFFDELNMEARRVFNTIPEIENPLTDYQRKLWENLISKDDVLTSAPTSTGKTYLILKYLTNQVINSNGAFAAIVVPTRALISEVSSIIHDILKDSPEHGNFEIVIIPHQGDIVFKDKTFFVMTQERLFEVLQMGGIYFNYLFIDEAHNIASDSRGVLLHLTLQKLLEDSQPQIIISMPSQEYKNSFNSVFPDVLLKELITEDSSVAKILMSIELAGSNISINRLNKPETYISKKGFTGTRVEDIANFFGQNECNIIYKNQKNHCESTANNLAKLLPLRNDQDLEEAANYVETFLHEKFTLADNLRHGVAFHYGALPSITRMLIEHLVRNDKISFIVCTSTLIEGINLPAKNLFLNKPAIQIPNKKSKKMDDVQIKNIIGRAGRMLQHFAGNVFLINPKKWEHSYDLDDSKLKPDKIPTFFDTLNNHFDRVVNTLKGVPLDLDDISTYYSIANKLLSEYSNETISRTLNAKELTLSDKNKTKLINVVKDAYEKLTIAQFIVSSSPTIGYMQQNNLYNFLMGENDLNKWVLPHPASNMYESLLRVLTKLCDLGLFFSDTYSLEFLTIIASKWIQGDPIKTIITEQIDWNKTNNIVYKSVNRCVRDVIKVIDTYIRFRMANALKCYHTILKNVILKKGIEIQNVNLHGYIEVGGYKDRFMNLVSIGLSRDTSIETHRILNPKIQIKSADDLKHIYQQALLKDLHPVMKKELDKLFS